MSESFNSTIALPLSVSSRPSRSSFSLFFSLPLLQEAAWGKPIQVAFRETVESEAECMINSVKEGKTVSLLVVGDPFG